MRIRLRTLVATSKDSMPDAWTAGTVVIINGEFGWIEEFTSTYVVIRLWDWRRMIVPLGYFLENPFQNWTRSSATLIGSVYFHLDHRTPIPALRAVTRP